MLFVQATALEDPPWRTKSAPGGPEPFLDWDKALLEWEEKSFDPEVAKDMVPERAAPPPPPVSRPLYRPPTTALPKPPPKPKAPPPPPPAPVDLAEPLEEDAEGDTLNARIPRELLRAEDVPPTARVASMGREPEAVDFDKTGDGRLFSTRSTNWKQRRFNRTAKVRLNASLRRRPRSIASVVFKEQKAGSETMLSGRYSVDLNSGAAAGGWMTAKTPDARPARDVIWR